jgi:hypothetical protein
MSSLEQERERAAVRSIQLSVDLLAAARCQMAVLGAVDQAPGLHTPAGAQQAARR